MKTTQTTRSWARTQPSSTAPAPNTAATKQRASLPTIFTGAELDAMILPPLVLVVPGLLPSGMALQAAAPKAGKSWFALHLCLTIAAGGTFLGHTIQPGSAFYLALEDRHRRLQDRSRKLTKDAAIPANVTFAIEAPKLGDGLIEMIEKWRVTAANPRLVVIDTLTNIMPDKKSGQSDYDAANAALKRLHHYALEHELAILVIHHTRKPSANAPSSGGDPMREVMGSTGIVSPMDTVLVLKRARNQNEAVLHIMSKDIPERGPRPPLRSRHMHLDHGRDRSSRRPGASTTRRLRRRPRREPQAGGHQAATGKERTNVNNVLKVLQDRGLVNREARGHYSATAATPTTMPASAEHASDNRDLDDIIAAFLQEADQDANTALPN